MSTHPQEQQPADDGRAPVTLPRLAEMKANGEPIVMVTAYDYPSALVAEEAGVDIVLVGDTAAMVVLGYDATTPVGMDEMPTMAAAVRRGLRTPLLIGDMPFGSYERSNEHAIENAQRFVREAGCRRRQARAAAVHPWSGPERSPAPGIPVMGHVGLTPQIGERPGRLQGSGQHRRIGGADRRGCARAPGGGMFRDRLRGGSGGGHRALMPQHRRPGDRDRRGARHRRPGPRLPRPARHLQPATLRSSSSATPTSTIRWWPAFAPTRGGPVAPVPRRGSRLLGGSGGGRRADGISGSGKPRDLALGLVALREDPAHVEPRRWRGNASCRFARSGSFSGGTGNGDAEAAGAGGAVADRSSVRSTGASSASQDGDTNVALVDLRERHAAERRLRDGWRVGPGVRAQADEAFHIRGAHPRGRSRESRKAPHAPVWEAVSGARKRAGPVRARLVSRRDRFPDGRRDEDSSPARCPGSALFLVAPIPDGAPGRDTHALLPSRLAVVSRSCRFRMGAGTRYLSRARRPARRVFACPCYVARVAVHTSEIGSPRAAIRTSSTSPAACRRRSPIRDDRWAGERLRSRSRPRGSRRWSSSPAACTTCARCSIA